MSRRRPRPAARNEGPARLGAAAGARRLPAQDRAQARSARRARRRSVCGGRAGGAGRRILAETIERIVADFPWPKSMRWGDGDRCAGCGRCTASSPCSARTSCRSRSTASRAARPRSATASTIPARHHRRCGRLHREAARLPRDRRPGRARETDPRGRGKGGEKSRADAAARRGPDGRECRLTESPVPLVGRLTPISSTCRAR